MQPMPLDNDVKLGKDFVNPSNLSSMTLYTGGTF